MIKVVERIAPTPFCGPMFVVWPIPRRRCRVVNVSEPPNGVELVVEMDPGLVRWRCDGDGVPGN